MPDQSEGGELARMAALASVAPPAGATSKRNFRAARKVLGIYTVEVVETARGDAPVPDGSDTEASCPLRPDEPGAGFPDGTALELAPEQGERLVQVPRVLGGGPS